MFEAAVVKLVKSVSNNDLEPVPDLYSAEFCKPWKIVVRKEKKYFWNHTKFVPTQFSLPDIIVPSSEKLNTPTTNATFINTYAQAHKLSLDGKLGAKLKDIFEIDLAGHEYIELHSDLGEIAKVNLNIVELNKFLESGLQVDLKNEFIKQVSSSKRNSLCLVTSCLELAKACSITGSTDVGVDETITGNVPLPIVKIKVANADEKISFDTKKDKRIDLPAGTTLAFGLVPLAISENGGLSLVLDDAKQGGFHIRDTVDGLVSSSLALEGDMDVLLQLNHVQRHLLCGHVQNLCKNPRGVSLISCMLEKAYNYIGVKNGHSLSEPLAQTGQNFIGDARDSWLWILTMAGFIAENDTLTRPSEFNDCLESLTLLFNDLNYLGSKTILAISSLDEASVEQSIDVLNKVVEALKQGNEVKIDETRMSTLPAPSKQLMQSLGVLQQDLLQRWERATAALRILNALWWRGQKKAAESGCSLL